jgi:lipopolysaccharide transport system ATP-binding protein
MSDTVIHVEKLSKRYKLGQREKYGTLRDAIRDAARAPFRKLAGGQQGNLEDEYFWALKDASFEVEAGDVVGVIGRNGSGKSTLLKLLSRITTPTEGYAEITGRVGSLLEVGTGFHPELTGRENIYLSGSILGMRRREIDEKFDEIVKFSEIERFLDTPVKRYSSGMYVRLAFAVAAHLDPEILLVDEVLAVGDLQFQKKCLGKMQDISGSGRTILFVSHAMDSIKRLCTKCILLSSGKIAEIGEPANVISTYLRNSVGSDGSSTRWLSQRQDPWQHKEFSPLVLSLEDEDGNGVSSVIGTSQKVWIRIEGVVKEFWPNLLVGIALYDSAGTCLFENTPFDYEESKWPNLRQGHNTLRGELPVSLLNAGAYRIEVISALHQMHWIIGPGTGPSVSFEVIIDDCKSPYTGFQRRGLFIPKMNWEQVE